MFDSFNHFIENAKRHKSSIRTLENTSTSYKLIPMKDNTATDL